MVMVLCRSPTGVIKPGELVSVTNFSNRNVRLTHFNKIANESRKLPKASEQGSH